MGWHIRGEVDKGCRLFTAPPLQIGQTKQNTWFCLYIWGGLWSQMFSCEICCYWIHLVSSCLKLGFLVCKYNIIKSWKLKFQKWSLMRINQWTKILVLIMQVQLLNLLWNYLTVNQWNVFFFFLMFKFEWIKHIYLNFIPFYFISFKF